MQPIAPRRKEIDGFEIQNQKEFAGAKAYVALVLMAAAMLQDPGCVRYDDQSGHQKDRVLVRPSFFCPNTELTT